MQADPSLDYLREAGIAGELRHRHSRTSSVTTSWGVDWDEELIARDLLQNFYDANRECLTSVTVVANGATVTVPGAATLELDRLFYLGSEKGDDDIGKYGEGFKVAAVCLLRNHRITPIVASRDEVVCIRIQDEEVSGTQLRPVVYDFFTSSTPCKGTLLILCGCSKKLIRAMEGGLSHFFHDRNPLLGEKLWSSWNQHFAVYRSTTPDGHLFYRRLRRGLIPELPVVLVIEKQFDRIEKKTRRDRDRNAFGDELMKVFYNVFARSGLRDDLSGQRVVLEAARHCWQRGHPLLNEIADAQRGHWPEDLAKKVFADEFFARATGTNPAALLQYEQMEKAWQREGRKTLPAYFRRFGVLNAVDHSEEIRRQALDEQKRRHQRRPTIAEQRSLQVLDEIIQVLAPEIRTMFARKSVQYTVAETEVLLGELKQHRSYSSAEIFLSAAVFLKDFGEATAVFLHEHAHIFGYDASRGFTDALTQAIESVLRYRADLDDYENAWKEAIEAVRLERNQRLQPDQNDMVAELIGPMSEQELRALVKRLPVAVVRRAAQERMG
jgi:hypothetical protein